jgi:hypothetical protein
MRLPGGEHREDSEASVSLDPGGKAPERAGKAKPRLGAVRQLPGIKSADYEDAERPGALSPASPSLGTILPSVPPTATGSQEPAAPG